MHSIYIDSHYITYSFSLVQKNLVCVLVAMEMFPHKGKTWLLVSDIGKVSFYFLNILPNYVCSAHLTYGGQLKGV